VCLINTTSFDNKIKRGDKMSDPIEIYTPTDEEIDDAMSFMLQCSPSDLADAWNKTTNEWPIDSVIRLHRELCKTGRINLLISKMSEKS